MASASKTEGDHRKNARGVKSSRTRGFFRGSSRAAGLEPPAHLVKLSLHRRAKPMLIRRNVLAGAVVLTTGLIAARGVSAAPRSFVATSADAADFARYVEQVKAEARRAGISESVLDAAFAHVRLNGRVIELDRNQPEVQFTWEHYRSSIVSDSRVQGGRAQYARHAALLRRVEDVYGVPGAVIVGLWGLESDYGRDVGRFNVIECVATLAWEGRRRAYFHEQLMDCLQILQRGDIEASQMLGSWAGAMGQTQFMPDCFLKYAVDFDNRGRRDLWNDYACVFASTANNIAQEGWRREVPWGWRVDVPGAVDPTMIGRGVRVKLSEWARLGVRRRDGMELPRVSATQFAALRAYNPSDKYALCIGLLADRIAA
jgi:membrane-bound lytic murein transglycosylase B